MRPLILLSRLAPVVLLTGLFAPAAVAQSIHATFVGVVRDDQGNPVPGATLTVENVETGGSLSTVSQENGTYQLRLVPVGQYRLRVVKDGFAEIVLTGLAASVNQNVVVDPVLSRVAAEERVEVVASTPLVDVRRVAQGITLTPEVIDALPVDARDVLNLQYYAPGTLPARRGFGYDGLVEVGTGAQQGQDNVATVDGGTINDPSIGFAFGGALPLNAVAEFQFLTSRYTAEFGGGSGGAVNIITKSGTNEHEVSAFLQFRNDTLDSDDPFASEDTLPFERQQFGVTLGGPIRRDEAHYFVAYDGSRQTQTQVIDTGGTLPQFEGPLDSDSRGDIFLAKLDYEPTPEHRLTFTSRYGKNRVTDVAFFSPGQIATSESRSDVTGTGYSLVFGHSWTLSDVAHNELRLHVAGTDLDFTANSLDPFEVRPSSYTGGAPFLPQGRKDDRYQLTEAFSRYFASGPGGHLLKVGGELQWLPLELFITQFLRGAFLFETDAPFDATDPATFPVLHISGYEFAQDRTIRQWGVFVNDEWTVTDRLFLNLGLRYDIEHGSTNSDIPNPVPFLVQPDLDTDNWSPRLGFTYQLGNRGATALRGGYGRYYTRLYQWLFDARSTSQLIYTQNPDYQGFTNPNGSSSSAEVSIKGTDPDIEIPYVDQLSFGVDHQFGQSWALSVDYVRQRGQDEVLQVEGNPLDPVTGERPDPAFGSVPVYSSVGESEYDGLQLYFRSARAGRWGTFGITYALSRTRNDHNYFTDLVQSVDELDDLKGYSLNDTRHRLAGQGLWQLPWKIRLGGVVVLATAQPFNVNNGLDENGDGILDRPAGVERNSERGDEYARIDLRVTRPFQVGRGAIEPTLEVFNLLDTTNVDPDSIVGNLLSPLYGQGGSTLAPLYQPRQVQLGVRFKYP